MTRHPPPYGAPSEAVREKHVAVKEQRRRAREAREAERAQRRVQVLEMKIGGATHEMIARQLDIATSTVANDIKRALALLAEREGELAANFRQLALARYERMIMRAMPHTRRPPGSDDYEPTIEQQLAAQDRVIRAQTRIDKLLGLESPDRLEVAPMPKSIAVEVVSTGVVLEAEVIDDGALPAIGPGANGTPTDTHTVADG